MRKFRSFAVLIFAGTASLSFGADEPIAQTAEPLPLQLEVKIPLGDARGRIDHMAVDLPRQRLFVAELGNDSVGVVDLKGRKVVHTITGLKEPQGVGYVPSTDTLYVANAGDGSVRLFQGTDYAAAGQIDLGEDADNIRVDIAANRVFVGYGKGALAMIDGARRSKIGDIPLKAHPESFQLDRGTKQIFVNLPDARAIAVIDGVTGQQRASWPIRDAGGNFPMALDEEARQVLTVFRNPAELSVFSMQNGATVASTAICGDSDDVFMDAKRHRVYVSCGEGFVDVLDTQEGAFKRMAHIPTVAGARTSLFVPELDRLFVAVRANAGERAAIWVFRPLP